MKYIFTKHAVKRWNERFPCIKMREQLRLAVPFGATFGKTILLISPIEAVFVVKCDAIVTVLTKHQALANIQAAIAPNLKIEPAQKTVEQPKKADIFGEQIHALAEEHAKEILKGQTGKKSRKRRLHEAINAGVKSGKHATYLQLVGDYVWKLTHPEKV